jgi:hypothetical protein
MVKVGPDSLLEVTGLTNMWRPIESNKGPEPLKTDRTHQVRSDLTRPPCPVDLSLCLTRTSTTDITVRHRPTDVGPVRSIAPSFHCSKE